MSMNSATIVGPRLTGLRKFGLNPGVQLAIKQALVALSLILLWQLALVFKLMPPAGMPYPLPTFQRLGALLLTGSYWTAVFNTMLGWFIGMTLSAMVAIPLGVIIGLNGFLVQSTRFTIDFMRTVPPVALLPVMLLLLGPSLSMKLALIISGSVWPLLIQSIYAAGQLDNVQRDAARSFRFNRWVRIRYLIVPSVTPFMSTGIRIAATISLLLSITAEYIGGAPGIGFQLGQAEMNGVLTDMYAYILTAAALGVALNIGFIKLQKIVLWWHPSVRAGGKS